MTLAPYVRTVSTEDGPITEHVIPLDADQGAAIRGLTTWQLVDRVRTALVTLADVRAAAAGREQHPIAWADAVARIEQGIEYLEDIKAAAIRAHKAAGGSIGALALELGWTKPKAQRAIDAAAMREDGWVSARNAEPEIGSPEWRIQAEARLRRAIDAQDSDTLTAIAEEAGQVGMHPSDLLTVQLPDEDVAARRDADESVMLHLAILWLVEHQDGILTSRQKADFRAITDKTKRAQAVVRLYSKLSAVSLRMENQETKDLIKDAYDLATRVVNAAKGSGKSK